MANHADGQPRRHDLVSTWREIRGLQHREQTTLRSLAREVECAGFDGTAVERDAPESRNAITQCASGAGIDAGPGNARRIGRAARAQRSIVLARAQGHEQLHESTVNLHAIETW